MPPYYFGAYYLGMAMCHTIILGWPYVTLLFWGLLFREYIFSDPIILGSIWFFFSFLLAIISGILFIVFYVGHLLFREFFYLK